MLKIINEIYVEETIAKYEKDRDYSYSTIKGKTKEGEEVSFSGDPYIVNKDNIKALIGDMHKYAIFCGEFDGKYKYTIVRFEDSTIVLEHIDSNLLNKLSPDEHFYYLEKAFKDLINTYKHVEVNDSSISSAPDTSKFKAHISGKLEILKRYTSYGGYYGLNTFYPLAIKIGSGIDSQKQKDILLFANILTTITMNGLEKQYNNVCKSFSEGTAFDTYGISAY